MQSRAQTHMCIHTKQRHRNVQTAKTGCQPPHMRRGMLQPVPPGPASSLNIPHCSRMARCSTNRLLRTATLSWRPSAWWLGDGLTKKCSFLLCLCSRCAQLPAAACLAWDVPGSLLSPLTWLCNSCLRCLFSSCSAATSLAKSATERCDLPPPSAPPPPALCFSAAVPAALEPASAPAAAAAAAVAATFEGLSAAWLSAASRLTRRASLLPAPALVPTASLAAAASAEPAASTLLLAVLLGLGGVPAACAAKRAMQTRSQKRKG